MSKGLTLQEMLDRMTAPGDLVVVEDADAKKLRCVACGHRCLIKEGRRGICKVRFNDGGTLRVTSWQAEDDRLAVAFSDTGHGIAPEDLKRVFEPFFSTREDGTGLGLTVSHNVVERHGGEITVESSVGQGTIQGSTEVAEVEEKLKTTESGKPIAPRTVIPRTKKSHAVLSLFSG